MRIERSLWATVGVMISFSLAAVSVFAAAGDDEDYDRLDGKGASLAKVDVIEWEGNLEIHVYPKGRIQGLGFKIDRTKKDKPVMVISYRFPEGKPLIRRAILGISLNDGFKVFKDPSVPDYDKVVLTNHQLSSPLVAYQTDPAPQQLYPNGHPLNESGSRSVASPSRTKVDLSNPQTRDALKSVDSVNPDLREVPKTGITHYSPDSERRPASASPSKFQNEKLDENTSGAVKVKEIELNQGFNW